jgi:hypothetical protein
VAAVAADPIHDELNLIDGQRRGQRLPVLDHVRGLARRRKVDRDRPPVSHPHGALDQAQRLVLADQLRVPEGIDEHLRVHRPGERARPG